MNYLLRHLKCIASFLAAIMLLQSCMIYRKNSTSFEEATKYRNTHTLIDNTEGIKYKVRWIEEKEDLVHNIANTERYFIDTAIRQSIRSDHIPLTDISFQMIQDRVGSFAVKTVSQKYTFIQVDVGGDYLTGYQKVGGKIYSINIPKDQISSIRLIDDRASERATKKLAVGIVVGLGILPYGMRQTFNSMPKFSWCWVCF